MIVKLTQSCRTGFVVSSANLYIPRGSVLLLLEEFRLEKTLYQTALCERGVVVVLPGSLSFVSIP